MGHKRIMYKKLFVCVVTIVFLLSSGCIGGDKEAGIRIGVQPASPCHVAAAVGFGNGLWDENLGVNTTMVGPFWAGGSSEMIAMRSGEMDVAYVGITPALFAIGEGLDAKVVSSINTGGQVLVVSATDGVADWNYTKPSDLEGKTIATLTQGSIQDIVLTHWLNEEDKKGTLDKSKITIKYMDVGTMLTSLATKTIDGFYMTMPFSDDMTEMLGTGVGTNLTSDVTWPGHPCCVLLASGTLIREDPEMVKKIVATHIEATEWALENPVEAAEISYEVFGWGAHQFPPEPMVLAMQKAARDETMHMDTNPHHIIPITMEIEKDIYDRGLLKTELTEEDIFDTSFYDAVTGESGE